MIMSFFQGLWNNLHEMSTEDAIEGTMKFSCELLLLLKLVFCLEALVYSTRSAIDLEHGSGS